MAHDVIHGYRTIFPIPLAIASSWDPEMAALAARVSAREARAAGIHWTYAPMLDVSRDPRWGRIAEGSGEDPYLTSVMGAAYVRGFQDGPAGESLLACAKHYVAYGAAVGGRDYGPAEISERTLREVYLPPFRAAIDAGVATVMTSFNTVNDVPLTADRTLVNGLLRGEWRFRGLVVSDWAAVAELINHGVAAGRDDAALKAITAGIDVDMWDRTFLGLADAVRAGKLDGAIVDDAVRRLLRLKVDAGVFERPFADEKRAASSMLTRENRAAARRVAQRSIVLLKNERELLPLPNEGRRLAVVGPFADARADMLGPWAAEGRAEDAVSLLDALRERKIVFRSAATARDVNVSDEEIARAVDLALESDVVLAVLGETRDMSGEAASRSTLDLPGRQQLLVDALAATGKPLVLVLVSGRPLAIPRAVERSRAVLQAWFAGTEAGNALADLVFGDVAPVGRLPVTVPRSVGQVPIFYAMPPSGRPAHPHNRYSNKYSDVAIEPLFAFGYGLSYTKFEYSDLQLSATSVPMSGSVTISATITNAGKRAGEEVVQLYVRDRVASVSRPVRELKGFQRVSLAAGESTRVAFTLRRSDLEFWMDGRRVVEPGEFTVWIAPDAASGVSGTFALTE